MCLLLPRQLIKVLGFFFAKYQAVILQYGCSQHTWKRDIFQLQKENHQNHRAFYEKCHLLHTGVVFGQSRISILPSITVQLASEIQEAQKWGFLSCLIKCKLYSRLLCFGWRFWEELSDTQKMQQNATWEERGKVYKYMDVLFTLMCTAGIFPLLEAALCIFQTYQILLIFKLLAWRKWVRYHHLFYL